MLRTPRAYQAIKSEVDQVCGTEPVKFEHLQKLKYVDAALKEALRLNPTAPGWTVAANEDETVLEGKYEIKKGQTVLVVLDALHKDPAVWGEDADEFRSVPRTVEQTLVLTRFFVTVLKECSMEASKNSHLIPGSPSVGKLGADSGSNQVLTICFTVRQRYEGVHW